MKQDTITARVINKIQGFYYVETKNEVLECKLRGTLKKSNNKFNCVVGDIVEVSIDNYIINVFERKNLLIRPIVANVDILAIQFSVKNPEIDFEKINLLILNSFYQKVEPIVIINKIDFLNEEEISKLKNHLNFLEKLNIKYFLISCLNNIGIDDVKKFLQDKTTVIGGPSGVGKSSLVNFLQDKKIVKTGEISERLKRGKHTTRDSNILKLENGGYIIDTPGFSSIEIPKIENIEILKTLFPEFDKEKSCKFLNCSHSHEPECVVKDAVQNGHISKIRYDFYIKVLKELTERWNRYEK